MLHEKPIKFKWRSRKGCPLIISGLLVLRQCLCWGIFLFNWIRVRKKKKERNFCRELLRTTTNELFLRKMGGEWHFVLFVKNSNTKILWPRTKCGCRAWGTLKLRCSHSPPWAGPMALAAFPIIRYRKTCKWTQLNPGKCSLALRPVHWGNKENFPLPEMVVSAFLHKDMLRFGMNTTFFHKLNVWGKKYIEILC